MPLRKWSNILALSSAFITHWDKTNKIQVYININYYIFTRTF